MIYVVSLYYIGPARALPARARRTRRGALPALMAYYYHYYYY